MRNQNNEGWISHIFNNGWVYSSVHRNGLARMTNNRNLSIKSPFSCIGQDRLAYALVISNNGLKLEELFVAKATCPLHIGSLSCLCYIYSMISVMENLYLDHCMFTVTEKRHTELHTNPSSYCKWHVILARIPLEQVLRPLLSSGGQECMRMIPSPGIRILSIP